MKKKILIFCILYVGLYASYAQPGSLDTTFGIGGKVLTDFGNTNDIGFSTAIQNDGKIVVAGYSGIYPNFDFAISRYNNNGILDSSFDSDGKATTNFDGFYNQCRSITIQSDGKIVVAGFTMVGNFYEYDFALARYNSNGELDNTFGSGGKVTTDIGSGNDLGMSVAIQSDGKILLAGYSYTGNNTVYDFALIRYNSDGSLDNTFSSDGKVTTSIGNVGVYGANVYNYAKSVMIQSDGKIVVAGYSEDGEHSENGVNSNANFTLVRYESNGSLDSTFGSSGITITDFGSYYEEGNSVVMQCDGKIVVAGKSHNFTDYDFALIRYNSDGSLDGTFGSGGKVTTAIGNRSVGYSVTIQSDEKIVVAGVSSNGTSIDFSLVRYHSDGSLDNTFSSGGIVTTAIGNTNDVGMSVAIQSDGKIVLAGHSDNGSNIDFAVVRYNNDACPLINLSQSPTICNGESVAVSNNTYTTSGTYKDTLMAAFGCDSMITTNLTVNSIYNVTLDTTISIGNSIQVGDSIYNSPGTYTNTLFSSKGCDSIVSLNLTVLLITGIGEEGIGSEKWEVKIYPNPTNGKIQLIPSRLSGEGNQNSLIGIEIYNLSGEKIYSTTVNNKQKTVDISAQPKGIYFVEMSYGNERRSKKIILE